MTDNDTEGSSSVVKQDNTNEISKTSSPDLEIQDTIDLHNISMVGTTYDKPVKVGITLPGSLIKQTDKTRGDVPRSRAVENYLKQGLLEVRLAHNAVINNNYNSSIVSEQTQKQNVSDTTEKNEIASTSSGPSETLAGLCRYIKDESNIQRSKAILLSKDSE
jgi:hypothetical protein